MISAGGLVGLGAWFLADLPEPWLLILALAAWVLLTAALGWYSERFPPLQHRCTRYRVSPDGMEIRKGVFWRGITNVPRSRVQHTDVTQGPLMRRYGLARLVIHTAGTEAATVDLGGLAHETALEIRDFLIRGGEGDAV